MAESRLLVQHFAKQAGQTRPGSLAGAGAHWLTWLFSNAGGGQWRLGAVHASPGPTNELNSNCPQQSALPTTVGL